MAVADKLAALRIKANIIADKLVGLTDVEVDVHDGVAVLTGEVESQDQKDTAEEIACAVDGIQEVENQIRVVQAEHIFEKARADAHLGYSLVAGDVGGTAFSLSGAYAGPGPGLPTSEQFPGQFTDEQVEEHVRSRLTDQDVVDVSQVSVHVDNQVAHLTGSVSTMQDLNNLRDLVTNARGIMGIESEVTVREGEVGTETG